MNFSRQHLIWRLSHFPKINFLPVLRDYVNKGNHQLAYVSNKVLEFFNEHTLFQRPTKSKIHFWNVKFFCITEFPLVFQTFLKFYSRSSECLYPKDSIFILNRSVWRAFEIISNNIKIFTIPLKFRAESSRFDLCVDDSVGWKFAANFLYQSKDALEDSASSGIGPSRLLSRCMRRSR